MAKGYRQMLCDRMPQTLDIALRYCKAKNMWIDYVYDNIIKKYPQKERSVAVKKVLGLIPYYNIDEIVLYFRQIGRKQSQAIPKEELKLSFKDTIMWEKMASKDLNELQMWQSICTWVTWFKYWYSYIENAVVISMKNGKTYSEICKNIEDRFLSKLNPSIQRDKLAAYLVDNIKKFNRI